MPHKCVKCNRVYEDELPDVGVGCECGSKVFLFVKNGARFSHVKGTEGRFDLDLAGLFGLPKQDTRHRTIVQEGTYEIDLAAAFGLPKDS